MGLTATQQASWDENGFFIVRGWADEATVTAMVERIIEIVRSVDAGAERPELLISAEGRLADAATAEERTAKVFRLMRTVPEFRAFATEPRLLDLVAGLIGPDVDCFLSQFIFKHPGALGQPWHQDDYYFRMTPLPQVGVWLACTAATAENGPLHVVPGSHTEQVHDAVRDTREGAGMAYVEIVGADTDGEQVVLMDPGDLLVFHSRLRHRSTDNNSDVMRAAMVYHYAHRDTVGSMAGNHDWAKVLRDGSPVEASHEPTMMEWVVNENSRPAGSDR